MAGRVKWFFRNLFWDLAVLTEWWPWLSSWFDTWSLELDPEFMARVHDIERWTAEGTLHLHTVPLNEVLKEAGFTQEDPESEVGRRGNLVFLCDGKVKPEPFDGHMIPPPKIRQFDEHSGKEVKL